MHMKTALENNNLLHIPYVNRLVAQSIGGIEASAATLSISIGYNICTPHSTKVTLHVLVSGEAIYETVKTIPANSELVVYYLPERSEEAYYMPAVNYLRHALYRRTLEGE